MKNLLISALVVGALVCPVAFADDTMGSPAAPVEGTAPVAPAHEVKPAAKQHQAKKHGKKHGKKRHHRAKRSKHHHKHSKAESSAERKIDKETELNNH